MFHFVAELDPVSQPPLLCSKHLCSEKTRLPQTENIHHTIPRYQLKIHIILYFQDQYVNFLSTVDPFLGPVLDLASYVSPGIIKMVYGCKILHLIRKGKYSKYVHWRPQTSLGGDGWLKDRRGAFVMIFFLREKPTRWGEFTFQLETSSFLSKEKTRSKTFSTFEFNMVVEALAFQKYSICWVFRSYSVQPHFQCKLKSSRVQR